MALNVPINLMSAAAPPPQQPASSEPANNDASAVQPAAGSSGTSSASTNNNSGQSSSQQQQQAQTSTSANTAKSKTPTPDKAEPQSVVAAQIEQQEAPSADALADARRAAEANQTAERTEALIESVAVAPEAPSILVETPEVAEEEEVQKQDDFADKQASELDRFSPPDPLPTAPILKAADSYSAMSTEA